MKMQPSSIYMCKHHHSQAPPVIDIGELCCWVSDMLRDSTPHARVAMPKGMQHEIGGRFGLHEEDASNNLFGWLVRLQRAGPHNANGALLDPASLQAPGRGERVCPAVARYVFAQLGGQAGALAWLQDAHALGFDTAGQPGHSRGGSDGSEGGDSPDSGSHRTPAQRRYDACLARVWHPHMLWLAANTSVFHRLATPMRWRCACASRPS